MINLQLSQGYTLYVKMWMVVERKQWWNINHIHNHNNKKYHQLSVYSEDLWNLTDNIT